MRAKQSYPEDIAPRPIHQPDGLLRRHGTSFVMGDVVVAKPSHPAIAALYSLGVAPAALARKNWIGSYLLVDYLRRRRLRMPSRVLEVGCGWGLAAIYLARCQYATVDASDIDPNVFPFLQVQARLNGAVLKTRNESFDTLCRRPLPHQLLIGADICYSEAAVADLVRLVRHAMDSGVAAVLVADLGRRPFHTLREKLERHYLVHVETVTLQRPADIQGYVLSIRNIGTRSPWLPAVSARF